MRIPAVLICLLILSPSLQANQSGGNSGSSQPSQLSSDLDGLIIQGNALNTQLSAITLSLENNCAELQNAIHSVEDYTLAITAVSDALAAPLTLDVANVTALDTLSTLSANIASTLPVLAGDVSTLALNTELPDIQSAIDTMLALSDDIGVMADRILEMADKILVMADNIGLMADRILLTQQIQSTNLLLTQSFILNTQANMVALSVTIDTSAYNAGLSNLINTGNQLSADMNNSPLNTGNLTFELASIEARVKTYQQDVQNLFATVSGNTAMASSNINGDTLTLLGDLSVINAALAASLNQFSQTVTLLAPDLGSDVLNDALYSMLRLAADIGVMGGRIVEMGDLIYLMADNIGIMAGRIVETQVLQQGNLELTQSNLAVAQNNTVALFAAFGL
ncbi:MAG: hypothetical protein ABFS24_08215 [Pseudomonadota bacterium]